MVFEIAAAIITLVFCLLVFYLIKMLKDLQSFLKTSKKTVENLEIEVASIKADITPLIKGSADIVTQLNNQMEAIDPLIKSIGNVGLLFNEITTRYTTHKLASFEKKASWQEKIPEFLELTSKGLKIFQQIQKRR